MNWLGISKIGWGVTHSSQLPTYFQHPELEPEVPEPSVSGKAPYVLRPEV